jgi:hypothetical protein
MKNTPLTEKQEKSAGVFFRASRNPPYGAAVQQWPPCASPVAMIFSMDPATRGLAVALEVDGI